MANSEPAARGLKDAFLAADAELTDLEQRISTGAGLALAESAPRTIALVSGLARACIAAGGRNPVPDAAADILDVLRALVKGDPSWNAIRDNCRELVYYRNCINIGREDALPPVPEKMAVRTARHVYLYMKTRCEREGRLDD